MTTKTPATTLEVEDPLEGAVATSGAQETGIEDPAGGEPATLAKRLAELQRTCNYAKLNDIDLFEAYKG